MTTDPFPDASRGGFTNLGVIGAFVALAVVMVALGDAFPWIVDYPADWQLPIIELVDDGANWLIFSLDFGLFTFRELTRALAWLVSVPLDWTESALVSGFGVDGAVRIPWVGVLCLVAIIGHYIRGWRLAFAASLGVVYLAVFGQWQPAMQTLSVVIVCVPAAAMIGLILGVAATRRPWIEKPVVVLVNLMQSIPHYAYFLPVVFFFGIGLAPGAIATIAFATPPMARCAMLGLKRVPAEVLEAGAMCGTTPWQRLVKVELPSARPTLMVGLNQVIMQTLGMVVIASLIGVKGLGYDLLFSLQNLKLGRALEQGLAIVVIAIVLDRLSQAYAVETPWLRHRPARWVARHAHGIAAIIVLAVVIVLSQPWPGLQVLPAAWTISTAAFWDDSIRAVTDGLYGVLTVVKNFLVIYVFLPIKKVYQQLPWSLVVLAVGAVGFRLGGWRLCALVSAMLLAIAASGYWDVTMLTVYLVTVSIILCVVIGVPVGFIASRNDTANRVIGLWCDTFQTFPSFVYLIPVVMLFKVGDVAAVMAVVIWAVIPMIRYTNLGLRGVPSDIVEAAVSVGCTSRQLFWRVRLPLALPEMLLGLNQTIMFALFMVVIAALIGTQDLGREIMLALSYSDIGAGLVAGLCIAFIGIISDQLIGQWSRQRKLALGIA